MTGSTPNDGVAFLRDAPAGGTCSVTSPPPPRSRGGGAAAGGNDTVREIIRHAHRGRDGTRPAGE